jgi:hypothetical protein
MRLRQTQTRSAAPTARQNNGIGLSDVSVNASDGDDLKRSRYFSLKAGQEMAAIIDADRKISLTGEIVKGRDPVWLCERLSTIQREAKRARARSVYRSAQDALNLIQRCNAHMPIDWTRVDGRLFVLNKLLGQYEEGLSEVESEMAVDTADFTVTQPTIDEAQTSAKQTLTTLLPHASEAEHAALNRLMDLDLTSEPSVESPSDLETASEKPGAVSVDRIEWIMPDLVQKLLEIGRQYGKVFSVSHSPDDVLIEAGSEDVIYARLYERLSDVIASNLPLQGLGRVDINASSNELHISGSGFDSFAIPFPERIEETADDAPQSIASDIDIEFDVDPITAPLSPMITDENEAELRAQLAALMDVGMADLESLNR